VLVVQLLFSLHSASPSCDVLGGHVRKLARAAIAPVGVLASLGMIRGGGRGPVKGILISGGRIRSALWAMRLGDLRWQHMHITNLRRTPLRPYTLRSD
jgi:hypothetical protein